MMNPEAFKKSVFILKDKLYRFANRFLEHQEDAYDLVQEVMLKLWEQREQLERVNNIEAFSMQMVKNLAYNKIDKLGRQAKYLSQLPPDIQEEKYPSMTKELVLKMIDELPEKQRLVMYLRDIEEYEIADIAEVSGIDDNAVRVNLSRARLAVREKLTKIFEYEKRRIG